MPVSNTHTRTPPCKCKCIRYGTTGIIMGADLTPSTHETNVPQTTPTVSMHCLSVYTDTKHKTNKKAHVAEAQTHHHCQLSTHTSTVGQTAGL